MSVKVTLDFVPEGYQVPEFATKVMRLLEERGITCKLEVGTNPFELKLFFREPLPREFEIRKDESQIGFWIDSPAWDSHIIHGETLEEAINDLVNDLHNERQWIIQEIDRALSPQPQPSPA